MNGEWRRWPRCLWVVLLAAGASTTAAQSPANRVELTVVAARVSRDLGDWRSVAGRWRASVSPTSTLYVESLWQRAFGDDGVFASVAEQHAFAGDRWLSYVAVGSGTGDFVLPDLRADAQLGYKWGPRRRLVTTLGATAVNAKRGYSDVGAVASLTAYVGDAVVAEVGERVTRSNPGGVTSARTSGAVTVGRERRAFLVLRGSGGREGYQLIGPTTAIRRFDSHEVAVSWRQWFGNRGGMSVQGERYDNDLYTRTGVSLGVFVDW